ncbi:MAG: hypothetical protein HY739_01590 [Desulfobacterales bacterium]|nr:hypothetical protein [Desulfobacterales bacterium]
MKKKLILIAFALVLLPVLAFAAQIEGTVQGYHCVTQGKICPIGQEDPLVALEQVFVVLTAKDGYYFVSNLDRAVLSRYINTKVRVTGNISAKFKAITAEKFEVSKKGGWVVTWTKEMQKQLGLDLGL